MLLRHLPGLFCMFVFRIRLNPHFSLPFESQIEAVTVNIWKEQAEGALQVLLSFPSTTAPD